MTKDEELAILSEMRRIMQDAGTEELRASLRLVRDMKLPVKWADYGRDLIDMYLNAIRAEFGDEAVEEFSRGLFTRAGN